MKNTYLFLLSIFTLGLILAGCAQQQVHYNIESGVVRSFDKTTVAPGEAITVTLDIKLRPTETYYAFEEKVPAGFVIANKAHVANVIREVEIQNAKSTTYTYTVMAPSESGIYTFSGEYSIESSEVKIFEIKGDGTITVS